MRGLRGKVQRLLTRLVPESAHVAIHVMQQRKRGVGLLPGLIRPKTYDEHVLHRIIFDRRPILTTLLDKYAVRDYVKERTGEHILTKLYLVTTTPAEIAFDDLPDKFVVKPTHGSGWIYLVPDKARAQRQDIIDRCTSWLNRNFYDVGREWAYKHIQPRIMVEEHVSDGSGPAPIDYKYYVFGGRVYLIQIVVGRFVASRQSFYDRSWNKLDVRLRAKSFEGEVPRPTHLDEMIAHAERLGEGLDFVRVDLYDTPDKVYFGEMTVTPARGTAAFKPDEFNRYLGRLWTDARRRSAVPPRRSPSRATE